MTEHIYVKIQGGENTQSCELTAVNYLVWCWRDYQGGGGGGGEELCDS